MAKRSRGARRPGQRRPLQRAAQRPAAPAPRGPAGSLTAEEEARAAELEAQLMAEERAAENARSRARERARSADEPAVRGRTRDAGLLATRAAEEYSYVSRDLRRIVVVDGALLTILGILFALHLAGILRA